ncbi:MAG: trypsin-like peptidase domain-containing protein [Planctomycetota bacterium]
MSKSQRPWTAIIRRPASAMILTASLSAGAMAPLRADEPAATDLQYVDAASVTQQGAVTATSYRGIHQERDDSRRSRARSLRETPTVSAIRRASPAVVNLHGQKTIRANAASVSNTKDVGKQVNGMGTGVIIDPRGYVITNFHVVEDVAQINVTLHDGTTTQAELIASDPPSDLALVKVLTSESLPTIPRGRSDDLMIGETVIAIGNAYGYVHTSTQGIISALHRDIPVNEVQQYRDLIQTSAGINPGNSGGPLLNIDGDIIGINVAVRVNAQQIAFAIPIDQVFETVSTMISRYNSRRLVVGLSGHESRDGGLVVTRLTEDGAAHQCGLEPGDRIVSIDGAEIENAFDYRLALLNARLGDNLTIEFDRAGKFYQTDMATVMTSGFETPAAALAWQVVGIRVRQASSAVLSRVNRQTRQSYRGALVVTDVRPGSAADEEGILNGDLLLGLHSWQTASVRDLTGILEQPEIKTGPRVRFYLHRGNQTMYSQMQLAAQSTARVSTANAKSRSARR